MTKTFHCPGANPPVHANARWTPSGLHEVGGLFVYAADPPRRIPFENPAASLTTTPDFAPDGRRLVFASSATEDGCCGLFIADLDGKNRRLIASSHGADTEPKVNPKNPNEIAFVSDRGGLPQTRGPHFEETGLLDICPKGVVERRWRAGEFRDGDDSMLIADDGDAGIGLLRE